MSKESLEFLRMRGFDKYDSIFKGQINNFAQLLDDYQDYLKNPPDEENYIGKEFGFLEGNNFAYYQDAKRLLGIPYGIKFEVKEKNTADNTYWLAADGYGNPGVNYGSGMICISGKLLKEIVEILKEEK